jgi:hypothetical protein
MSVFLYLTALGLFCFVSVQLAVFFLETLESDRKVTAKVKKSRLFTVCFLVSLVSSVYDGVLVSSHLDEFGLILLVVWATIAAYIDRYTTWVPDICIIMLLLGSLLHNPSVSAQSFLVALFPNSFNFSIWAFITVASCFALIFWMLALVLFEVQRFLGVITLTAADIIAVSLPLIAFGTSFSSMLTYFLAVCLILLSSHSKILHRLLADESALRAGLDDVGHDEISTARALPAFVVFAPLTSLVAMSVAS